ncbi:hypothetical protein BHM03_00015456 [Ensete ventricosum]|nr:hypothetical protein BHM03_00015456 [Ensete ventricosum]
MRERAMSKKPAVQSAPEDQSITTSYMDMKGVLSIPHVGSESASDLSALVTRDNHRLKETEKNNFSETEHKGHYASSRSMPQVSSGEGSSRTVPHGYTPSEASDVSSKRLKFLCSFGGKIIPRPSDGKLRYVGGDTRIIRVSRDISWKELMQKTMAICGRPHTVKYQLPGEDLDALISVSCDEDLQNMMEEYSILEGGEGPQKLRMFLFTSDDFDDVHFSFGSMEGDSEIQYVVAVNGMDLGSGKASYGYGLPSTSTSDLDQLLNLNIEPERANAYTIMTPSAGFAADPVASPATLTPALQASSSTNYGSYSQGFEDHRYHYVEGEHYAYSHINPPDRYPYSNSRISIPLPAPSDYQYSSNYTATSTSTQPGQQTLNQAVPQVPHYGISLFDKETVKKDAKVAVDGSSQRKTENEHTGSHKDEPISTIQQHDITVPSYIHAESMGVVAASENSTTLPPSKGKGKQPEPGLVSSTNAANVAHGSDLNEHDQYSSNGALMSGSIDDEADVTDVSYSNPPSCPSRSYQSERLPREQAEFLNRLSKSDDSIGSQYLINQASLIAAQESIPEVTDTILEGDLGSQTDKFLSSAKPPSPSNAATEDKYKKVGSTITQANKFEPVSTTQGSEIAKFSQPLIPLTNHNMHDPNEGAVSSVQAGPSQIDAITDEKSYKQGGKIQKTEFQHAPLKSAYDKATITEGMEKVTTVAETDMVRINIKEAHADGASVKPQEHPSTVPDIPWEGIPNNDTYNTNVVEHAPAFNWVESTVGAISQDSSAPSSERRDILIDINDRFPPNMLSDIFNKARIDENLSNINPLRNDDTGCSLTMQNHEPKPWSFFRKLAQDEFKQKDFSLMDQDPVNYTSLLPKVEEGISNADQFAQLEDERVYFCRIDPQINFNEGMQESSNTIAEDPNILDPGYIPSQVSHPLGMGKGEGLQVENPFTRLGETLRTHISEIEVFFFC